MHLLCSIVIFLTWIFLVTHKLEARALANGGSMATHARSLDDLIQLYAFRSLVKPTTGVIYSAKLPSIITGIRASIVRLRSGSFNRRGLHRLHEFQLPPHLFETPYFLRMALIYQNMGNWSSVYYSVPGYRFLTPVLGLLAYDATDLRSTNHQEVKIFAPEKPIFINFKNVGMIPDNLTAKCVQVHIDGSYQFHDLKNGGRCEVFSLGHYSIAVQSTDGGGAATPASEPPLSSPPGGSEFNVGRIWKIVAGLVGGLMGLVVVVVTLVLFIHWWRRREMREMREMEKITERGEVLDSQNVGDARLPFAPFVRTNPVLEIEEEP